MKAKWIFLFFFVTLISIRLFFFFQQSVSEDIAVLDISISSGSEIKLTEEIKANTDVYVSSPYIEYFTGEKWIEKTSFGLISLVQDPPIIQGQTVKREWNLEDWRLPDSGSFRWVIKVSTSDVFLENETLILMSEFTLD